MDDRKLDTLRAEAERWMDKLLAAFSVEHRLYGIWEKISATDIRHGWDEQDRWYWVVPDYQRGRSRVLGVDGELLRELGAEGFWEAINRFEWRERVEEEPVLLVQTEEGGLSLEAWASGLDEAWFTDPRGGYFVAFLEDSGYRLPSRGRFLALHAHSWSAMGPENPRPPREYTVDELRPYMPKAIRDGPSP